MISLEAQLDRIDLFFRGYVDRERPKSYADDETSATPPRTQKRMESGKRSRQCQPPEAPILLYQNRIPPPNLLAAR